MLNGAALLNGGCTVVPGVGRATSGQSYRNVKSKMVWFCLKNTWVQIPPGHRLQSGQGSAPAEQSYTLGSTWKGLWIDGSSGQGWGMQRSAAGSLQPIAVMERAPTATGLSASTTAPRWRICLYSYVNQFWERGKIHSSASKILNDRSGQNFSRIYREVQRKYPFFDRLT